MFGSSFFQVPIFQMGIQRDNPATNQYMVKEEIFINPSTPS